MRPKTSAGLSRPALVVRLSVPTQPLMSIIERHVKMSAAARSALENDLAEALQHAGVQLSTERGQGVGVGSETDEILSTEQAAKLLGVSRPFVVKLIDSGVLHMHQRVGNQRRVLKSAVLQWRSKERARQAKALKRFATDLDDEIFSRS
jgi:excisionase family DNA binding protein